MAFNFGSLCDDAIESLNKFSLGGKKDDKDAASNANLNKKELKVSPEELDKALAQVQKKGKDGLDAASTAILTALGAAGGMASAGAIAGAVGATSITGLTTAASLLGVTAVAATPVGWIIGAGVAGAALFGGGAWLKGSSAVQSERRRLLKENLQEKLDKLKQEEASATENDKIKRIAEVMRIALLQDRIPQELAGKIYVGFQNGTISSKEALALINAQCNEINVIDVEKSFSIGNKLIEARNILKKAYLNKKISQKLGMQLLGTLETPQITYAEVDDIIKMLSELCGYNENSIKENNNTNNNELNANTENIKVQQQVEYPIKQVSGDDFFKQTITLLKSAMAENKIPRDEGIQILCKLRAKNISCEEVISYLDNNVQKIYLSKKESATKNLQDLLIDAVKNKKIDFQQAQMFVTMVENKQMSPEQLVNIVENM